MTETANILNNATKNSLVLMDEIGRGTSTYDGLSLAWACAQWLSERLQAFTLFATHYFELTALSEQIGTISNVHLSAVDHNDEIRFMHQVQQGAANKSYGLQVAKLAGVPKAVIKAAKHKLSELEQIDALTANVSNLEEASLQSTSQTLNSATRDPSSKQINADDIPQLPQLSMSFDEQEHWLEHKLLTIDIDDLSPREALALMYQWRKECISKD